MKSENEKSLDSFPSFPSNQSAIDAGLKIGDYYLLSVDNNGGGMNGAITMVHASIDEKIDGMDLSEFISHLKNKYGLQ